MGFSCGIVGLPNVGKSTLFNALTATAQAESANYPFCTIEPNIGIVAVPDERLFKLAKIAKSAQIVPSQLEFVDIAGIVKGASQGEGLGNKFLANIREVDAILHVVRCFDNSDIVHVSGTINPLSDIETIETELLLADLESVEKRLSKKNKDENLELLQQAYELLKKGLPASKLKGDPKAIKQLQLITTKPTMFVCNVAEDDIINGNKYTEAVKKTGAKTVIISAAIEAEISLLNKEDKIEFMESLGIKSSGLDQVIKAGYKLLGLETYFTAGPKESKAWTITKGMTAPQAAGVIHSDFERGFICAETLSYDDFINFEGEQGAKQAGKLRLEGKDYVVQDGDVMHFRFNV